jgi:hypothetical protein
VVAQVVCQVLKRLELSGDRSIVELPCNESLSSILSYSLQIMTFPAPTGMADREWHAWDGQISHRTGSAWLLMAGVGMAAGKWALIAYQHRVQVTFKSG